MKAFGKKKREPSKRPPRTTDPRPIDLNNECDSDDGEDYTAKRSNRVPTRKLAADGDTWVEGFAVVENIGPRGESITRRSHRLRSYFESRSTSVRVWDEPPSGASVIEYAAEETRVMAELQVTDLAEADGTTSPKGSAPTQKPKKKKLGLGFPWKNKKTASKKGPKSDGAPPKDDGLQMAIALSMAEDGEDGLPPSQVPSSRRKPKSAREDDALAMAMALSISENESEDKRMLEEELRMILIMEKSAGVNDAAPAGLKNDRDYADKIDNKNEFDLFQNNFASNSAEGPTPREDGQAPDFFAPDFSRTEHRHPDDIYDPPKTATPPSFGKYGLDENNEDSFPLLQHNNL